MDRGAAAPRGGPRVGATRGRASGAGTESGRASGAESGRASGGASLGAASPRPRSLSGVALMRQATADAGAPRRSAAWTGRQFIASACAHAAGCARTSAPSTTGDAPTATATWSGVAQGAAVGRFAYFTLPTRPTFSWPMVAAGTLDLL